MTKRKKTRPKVAIWMPMPVALPNAGEVFSHLHEILMDAEKKKLGKLMPNARAGAMDYWRTRACIKAIENGATHILMLDADHKHGPPDLVERLLAHRKPVVATLNFARGSGKPCAIDRNGKALEPNTGLQEAYGMGTGAMLIELDAIKDLPQPWFFMAYGVHENIGLDEWPGEDGGFCILCRLHKIPLYCDTDLNSPHADRQLWV